MPEILRRWASRVLGRHWANIVLFICRQIWRALHSDSLFPTVKNQVVSRPEVGSSWLVEQKYGEV